MEIGGMGDKEMNNDTISVRQYLMLLTVGLLPPLVKLVPGHQTALAGRGAWLAPLAALLPALAAVWLISVVGQSLGPHAGLGEFLCLCLGEKPGRVLCGVYAFWMMGLAVFALRFCAERFTSTLYPDTGPGLFFLTLSLLVWQLGQRGLSATARAGELFFYGVVVMMVVILAMTAGEMRWSNLWPVWRQDIGNVLEASGEVLNATSLTVGALFLFSKTADRRGGGALTLRWTVGWFLVMTALGAVVLGVFGEDLVGRMQVPFFSLAKEVRVEQAMERLEPIVAAAWVFTDVILLSILLRCAQTALELAVNRALPGVNNALLLTLLPGAYLVAGSAYALERVYHQWETLGKTALFLAVPLVSVGVGKLRRVL